MACVEDGYVAGKFRNGRVSKNDDTTGRSVDYVDGVVGVFADMRPRGSVPLQRLRGC